MIGNMEHGDSNDMGIFKQQSVTIYSNFWLVVWNIFFPNSWDDDPI